MTVSGESTGARLLGMLVIIAMVASFAWRFFLIFHLPLNEDETDTLHRAWQIGHEGTMYIDSLEVRTPLSFQLVRPFLWLGQPSRVYLGARFIQVLLTGALFWFLFLFADALAGRRAALWAVLLVTGFNYFLERCSQARAEPLMLALTFAALWQWARWRAAEGNTRTIAVSGALFGLAFMTKPSALFAAFGPLAVWAVDLLLTKEDRRRAWRGLFVWGLAGLGAGALVLLLTCGLRTPEAVTWVARTSALLRYSEKFRGTNWFVLRTFYTNPLMWLALIAGLFWLPLQLVGARRRWTILALIGLGWGGVLSLVARGSVFEQDLVLPALLLAPAGGLWLARFVPLGGRRARLGTVLTVLLALGLLACAALEARYQMRYSADTIRIYRGVLAPFVGRPAPSEPPFRVDGFAFMDFLRGEHDRIHYYPKSTLAESLRLADFVFAASAPNQVVLTEAGLPIARPEAYRLIKASVAYHMALLERNIGGEDGCRSIARFLPGTCNPAWSPGQRLLALLIRANPDVIVFSYGVVKMVDYYPETRGWYLAGYQTWYDPATGTFVGLRQGREWPANPR